MLAITRKKKLKNYWQKRKCYGLQKLAKMFTAPKRRSRRDLTQLESEGFLSVSTAAHISKISCRAMWM